MNENQPRSLMTFDKYSEHKTANKMAEHDLQHGKSFTQRCLYRHVERLICTAVLCGHLRWKAVSVTSN